MFSKQRHGKTRSNARHGKRSKFRRLPFIVAAGVALALITGGALSSAPHSLSVPASAIVRGQTVEIDGVTYVASVAPDARPFCDSLAIFGDKASYGNFQALNLSASNVIGRVHTDYTAWRFALLAGYPRNILRTRMARLWKDCGE